MNDFAILAYLDFCRARNALKALLRSPGRLILWAVYAVWFAFVIVTRTLTPTMGVSARPVPGVPEPFSTMIAFGFIAALAASVLRGASGHAGAFASRADARFLTSSSLSERAVVSWLQLRSSAGLIARFLFMVFLYTMIFHQAGTLRGMMFSMLGGAALVGSVSIPALAFARTLGMKRVQQFATGVTFTCVAAAAVLGVSLVVRFPMLIAINTRITGLHGGEMVNAMLRGDGLALTVLWMLAAAMIALAYAMATDLYPELYAASTAWFERAGRSRAFGRGRSIVKYVAADAAPARFAFSGAWASISKDWIAFRRSAAFKLTVGAGLAFWISTGAAGGLFTRGNNDGGALFIALFGIFLNLLILFSLSGAVSLANDLRKPLWWLTADGLTARLCAWTIAGSWRLATGMLCAIVAYSAASSSWSVLPAGIAAAIAVPLMIRAVALATYSLVPAPMDQRGPLAVLRMLLAYALFVPPLAVMLITGLATHSAAAGVIPAVLMTFVETAGLVAFAAWRINGNGAAFALAEG